MARDPGRAGRILRFGIVGTSGVLVNQGLLMVLHGRLGLPLIFAGLLAIEASILAPRRPKNRPSWMRLTGAMWRPEKAKCTVWLGVT